MSQRELPSEDLQAAVEVSHLDLGRWVGGRVLFTGATGVLGSWMLACLLRTNEQHRMNISVTLVTRDRRNVPVAYRNRDDVSILECDVRELSTRETFDLVIHGAANAASPFGSGEGEPREMASTIVDGTRAVLDCAAANRARLLFLSSGGVYGEQFGPATESTPTRLNCLDPRSAYGEAKRLAELFCATASAAGEVDAVIARLFAFAGPRVPLDSYFAAGNFMGDLLSGRSISVSGDGQPLRSYLYCGDLPEWCFALAARGATGEAYNVGSDEVVTIGQLAQMVSLLRTPGQDVVIHTPHSGGPSPWYVPNIEKAKAIGLAPRVALPQALEKWLAWLS